MQIPDSEVPRLRQGSIFAFIAWLSYIFMVWSFKGVLMFLYNRLTLVPFLPPSPPVLDEPHLSAYPKTKS